jgi:predicted XRE-type DNA-binding protein
MRERAFVSKENIFADLGLKDSGAMKIRSDLMSEAVKIIRESGIPQKEIAEILNITPPKVSALMSGKINDFSNDTLMNYLTLLGCNIKIKVFRQYPMSKRLKRGMMKVERTKKRAKILKPKARRKSVSKNF